MNNVSYAILFIALILPLKEAHPKKTTMESDNPFIQRIHVDEEELENYEEISQQDAEKYRLRGQTIKFSHPEKFSFIDYAIEFIAMEIDEEMQVKSILLYLNDYETLQEILPIAFGPADLSIDIAGQADYDSGTEPQSYTSHTWKIENYSMTFSLCPVKEDESEQKNLKAQLYIRQ
ncbi:hypothetical protein [Catalinimonas niigatensis]|uniref:hypothetical protein n=1 Tax=Catalinimonas niigatensis TaxID=1397264 RepID=UPI002665E8C1|nr:hypothetical protein [Catalinimonas niigatensis]WPP49852.1 hypothetical protein PZB72_24575 [Catalinimonas niigatensis]